MRSMTGFGSATFDNGVYKIGIEIKAVNNRYKDISVRLPSVLRPLEAEIVKVLNKYNLRGKIDVFVNFMDRSEHKKQLSIDKDLLIAYYNILKEIREIVKASGKKAKLKKCNLIDVANYPGIINEEDTALDIEAVKPLLIETVDKAAGEFVKMKAIEGENLKGDLTKRLDTIAKLTDTIKAEAPARLKLYEEHIQEVLTGLLAEKDIDTNRIVQECALMADKIDITEELVRMASHLKQFNEALDFDGNIGRKLDFIVQEMNRETNTMASKANNAVIANSVVEIKTELEKIREQIQNIE